MKMEAEVGVGEEMFRRPRTSLASQHPWMRTNGGTRHARKAGAMKVRNGYRMDGGLPATTGTAMHGRMAGSRCKALLTRTKESRRQRLPRKRRLRRVRRLRRPSLIAASQQKKTKNSRKT